MVIFDAGLDEEAIRALVDQTTKVITDGGGTVNRVDRWGRRRFAYEVHHRSEGYYVLIEITAEPAVLTGLDRMLHLADEVIRHKVIRIPEQVAGRARPAPESLGASRPATDAEPAQPGDPDPAPATAASANGA
ncbi:MAG: 30S ribosomal protein S6 [Acidimicrobiaceae bacterium]|nr:30S ribosomal protein S6 [Acidimicrobiaceae bacterium]